MKLVITKKGNQQHTYGIAVMDVFVVIILLLEYRFFFIPRFPEFIATRTTYHNREIESIVIFLFFLFCTNYKKGYHYLKAVLTFLLIVICNMLYCFIVYSNASLSSITYELPNYLQVLLYFPLSVYVQKNYDRFIKLLNGFNIIGCAIVSVQAVVFNTTHKMFLYIFELEDADYLRYLNHTSGVYFRNGNLRITYLSTIVSIAMVIAIIDVVVNHLKYRSSVVSLILGFVYFFYVAQTRLYLVMFAGEVVLAAVFLLNKKKFIRWIFWMAVLVAVGIGIYFLSSEASISQMKQIARSLDASLYARVYSVTYFLSALLDNPIFGLGCLVVEKGTPYYHVIHGRTGYANFTDVGLLGSVAEFGIPMLIWFIYFMAVLWPKGENNQEAHPSTVKGFFLFILMSCVTLSVLDGQRIVIVPFVLALAEECYMPRKKKETYPMRSAWRYYRRSF